MGLRFAQWVGQLWISFSFKGCCFCFVLFRSLDVQLHEEDDALNMWMYDAVENNGKFSRWEALGQLATMFAILGGVFYLSVLYDAPSRNPAVSSSNLSLNTPLPHPFLSLPFPSLFLLCRPLLSSLILLHPSQQPKVPRQFPFDNLYLERGGDPNQPPSPEDLKATVQTTYGEYTS